MKDKETDFDAHHCDEYVWGIKKHDAPNALWWFLFVNRQPAALMHSVVKNSKTGEYPTLFADYKGKRVRVVMASRFGDVGITSNLDAEHGYDTRVSLAELSNFSDES